MLQAPVMKTLSPIAPPNTPKMLHRHQHHRLVVSTKLRMLKNVQYESYLVCSRLTTKIWGLC